MNLITGLSIAAALACSASAPEETTEKARKPNVILILADDMGYECPEVNGGLSYDTPNLNQMAEQGKRFNHCYAQPVCSPSREKIKTGLHK